MSKQLGIIMDPIRSINIKKDSSFALLLAAQARRWSLFYMGTSSLFLRDAQAYALTRPLRVMDQQDSWFEMGNSREMRLAEFNCILMRKDPPFDINYLNCTQILDHAEQSGVLVINRPQSLRDCNEKLFISDFPEFCVPTLVSANLSLLDQFLTQHQDIVAKPLDGMGGAGVFRVKRSDQNAKVIFETVTHKGQRLIMAQRYIPEISAGDKRILLIDGEPVPYALARVPEAGEHRGNLAAGGRGHGIALSERDKAICARVGPVCRQKGLLLVGIDVIGDYLTEINITSPTCIRELDKEYGLDIGGQLIDVIGAKIKKPE